jgi:cell division initiation protein
MNLTALEIKQRTFEKSLRGYDTAEVNAFLATVATEWEHMVGRMKDQEREIVMLRDKLKHYERVEAALHETLQTAKDSAEQRMETARKEALTRVEIAEMEAEKILREVRVQRQEIRQSILRLIDRRDEIIRGIGAYLDNAQKTLQSFNRDAADIYSLPPEDEAQSAAARKAREAGNKPETQSTGTAKAAPAGEKTAVESAHPATSTGSSQKTVDNPENASTGGTGSTGTDNTENAASTGTGDSGNAGQNNRTAVNSTETPETAAAAAPGSPVENLTETDDRKKSANHTPQKVAVPGGQDLDNILDEID